MSNSQGGSLELIIFKNGTRITPDNYPALFQSISHCRIELHQGKTSSVSITFTPALADALVILGSGILGFGGSDVNLPGHDAAAQILTAATDDSEVDSKTTTAPSNFTYYAVRLKYANGDSTPYIGGFTCTPTFQLGSTIEITVQFTGIQTLMSLSGGPVRFENVSVLAAVKQLTAKFGVEVVFDDDDTTTKALLSAATVTGSYNEDYDGIIRKLLADQSCAFTKHDGDGPAPKPQYRIKSVKQIEKSPSSYTFVMYRQVAPENGEVPIEEIHLESNGLLFQPGSIFGTFSTAVVSGKKEVKTVSSSPQAFAAQQGSGNNSDGGAMPTDNGTAAPMNTATGLVDSTAKVAGMYTPALENGTSSTLKSANARAEDARQKGLIFKVRTAGLPLVLPQQTVQLSIGSGKGGLEAFCGSCYVTDVAHDWSSEGWTTESTIERGWGPIMNPQSSGRASTPPAAPSNQIARKATSI